jgi:hypothetical protein
MTSLPATAAHTGNEHDARTHETVGDPVDPLDETT